MSSDDEKITLVHGAGGSVMSELIENVILPGFSIKKALDGIGLDALDDGGSIKVHNDEIVLTIDSHTVDPIFFPGGDIGKLAVAGTINDVAMMGATPVAILDAIIVEEGFLMSDLKTIINSMNETAKEVSVAIISGDFKVMPVGKIDRIAITTSGVGYIPQGRKVILDSGAKPGDKIIVTGTIGDHGVALFSVREGIEFDTELKSDVAPIWDTIEAALNVGGVHAMKDPTRGGLIQALYEIAEKSNVSLWIDEQQVPIREEVFAACEMLGIEPLELISEGKAVMIVDSERAEEILKEIRKTKHGKEATIIGEVKDTHPRKVFMKTAVGTTRFLDKPVGEPLPRIC